MGGEEAAAAAPDGPPAAAATRVLRRGRPPGLRRQLRNLLLLLLLSVVVSILGIVISSRIRPPAPLLAVGSVAPPIQPASSGPPLPDQVAAGAGHPLVVEFFETTCPVCQQAAASLCDLLQSHPAVSMVAVDAVGDSPTAIAAFRADHYAGCAALARISLISDPCPPGTSPAPCDNVTLRWKVSFVPTVYVLDAHGVIASASSGPGAVDAARAALDHIASTARPGP